MIAIAFFVFVIIMTVVIMDHLPKIIKQQKYKIEEEAKLLSIEKEVIEKQIMLEQLRIKPLKLPADNQEV